MTARNYSFSSPHTVSGHVVQNHKPTMVNSRVQAARMRDPSFPVGQQLATRSPNTDRRRFVVNAG